MSDEAGRAADTTEAPYLHVVRFTYGGPDDLFREWADWLDGEHIPAVLAVPGIRSYTRYAQLGSDRDFLTVWLVDGPHVFDEPAYIAARGWGAWERHMERWTISLLHHARAPRRFGQAAPVEPPL